MIDEKKIRFKGDEYGFSDATRSSKDEFESLFNEGQVTRESISLGGIEEILREEGKNESKVKILLVLDGEKRLRMIRDYWKNSSPEEQKRISEHIISLNISK